MGRGGGRILGLSERYRAKAEPATDVAISPRIRLNAAMHGSGSGYFRYVRTTSINSSVACPCWEFGAAAGIDNVHAYMILKYLQHKSIHGASGGGNELQDIRAAAFLLEGAFDRLDLPADSPHPIEKFGLLASRMGHVGFLSPDKVTQARNGVQCPSLLTCFPFALTRRRPRVLPIAQHGSKPPS